MRCSGETAARPTDVLFFYAEHGAVFGVGLFFAIRNGIEHLGVFHIYGPVKSAAASPSCLLICIPVIAVSLARILIFSSRTRMAKLTFPSHGGPEARVSHGRYTQERQLQNGDGR